MYFQHCNLSIVTFYKIISRNKICSSYDSNPRIAVISFLHLTFRGDSTSFPMLLKHIKGTLSRVRFAYRQPIDDVITFEKICRQRQNNIDKKSSLKTNVSTLWIFFTNKFEILR